jgi:HSP20 family protein
MGVSSTFQATSETSRRNPMARSVLASNLDPFAHLLRLQKELQRTVQQPLGWFASSMVGQGAFPPVNIFKRDDGCVVRIEVPGLSPEELSIESQGQSLKFSGKRGSEGESGTVHRNERWRGEFGRSVELPRELNPSTANADYKNGVLSIHVPLRDEAKPQQITVQAS